MKVLVINGSPKGDKSNTMNMTHALMRGMEKAGAGITLHHIKDLDMHSCLGCMSCWGQTAGECVIKDEMTEVMHKEIMDSDIIVESFPLYFFGMPGPMKTFQDRCMPLMETYRGAVKDIGDNAFHAPRFNMDGKKLVVVSSCGYGRTQEIFDSLIKQLNYIAGPGNYTFLACPQSEMFAIELMKSRIDEYLVTYENIGQLLAEGEEIPAELIEQASRPILPQRAFEALVTRYWDKVTPEGR